MLSSSQDHRGSHHPTRSTGWVDVGDALIDGLIRGLRDHVPGAVGIVVKSLAVCLSMAVAHLLGVSIAEFAVSAGVGTTAPRVGGIGRLLRGHARSK
jgi:hypothetical protein